MSENGLSAFVVIPTYNEAKTIGRIVAALNERRFRVIVVDDGSRDRTIIDANKYGAELIIHTRNEGKGRCVRDGLEHAFENGCDVVITLDGDGQHNLDDIDKFMREH
ncbi:MAG: glycosyltransferase family 2 protein, partial [Candidatus Omnitrophota bacterium]